MKEASGGGVFMCVARFTPACFYMAATCVCERERACVCECVLRPIGLSEPDTGPPYAAAPLVSPSLSLSPIE